MEKDQGKAFLAIILSGVILFGWQYFFAPKPVEKSIQAEVSPVSSKAEGKTDVVSPSTSSTSSKSTDSPSVLTGNKEEVVSIENDVARYEFDSYLNFRKIENKNSLIDFKSIVGEGPTWSVNVKQAGRFQKVFFNFTKKEKNLIEAESVNPNIKVSFWINDKNKLSYKFSAPEGNIFSFEISSNEGTAEGRSMPGSGASGVRNYLVYGDEVETFQVDSEEKGTASALWYGISFKHHLYAVTFSEKQPARYESKDGNLILRVTSKRHNLEGNILFTKKDYDHLIGLGENLHLAVDFGFFSVLAVPMLRILQWCYGVIPNYGVAIIILTILLRLGTFPFTWSSYKSMKKMQVIQPDLAKLKEKYKDDPQRMQQETMALFKKAGANPLGGCLPMLLQIPFFFAFYKVLYEAVELVGAPFFGWIHDLSLKDPYYVLPILMTVAFFLQQKFTPSASADPMQKKMMMFMPLIFGLIMKDLPSGLTLYIFISTLFGMAQQFLVLKRT